MNLTPEEALAEANEYVFDRAFNTRTVVKPEYVWSVVHHEYGTWLHLDVFDLNKQPTKPARKYTRKERYRYCAIISLPVCEHPLLHGGLTREGHPLGRCRICTAWWRSVEGYGSEDDLDAIDDLPWYRQKGQM